MVEIVPLTVVEGETPLESASYDVFVLVANFQCKTHQDEVAKRFPELSDYIKFDKSFSSSVNLVVVNGKRIVVSPTGPLNRCEDDVRRFFDAGEAGIKRALASGARKPIILSLHSTAFENSLLVTLLGAYHALYTTLEHRESKPTEAKKADALGIWSTNSEAAKAVQEKAQSIEAAKTVYRDILGSDPERMAPKMVEKYVKDIFNGTCVSVSVVAGADTLRKEYPCFAAVDRCANTVERHQGRVLWLDYNPGNAKKTLLLVGKGVTYDTGGADIKAGGHMAGMHRDKGGAAAVASFFYALTKMQPADIRVIGGMAMVRNSVGSEAYLADEIITSRAGVRVRVGNTDAEGRMAMVDVLCHAKEKAINEKLVDPEIYTIATLTGHACLAVGDYTAIVPNGPYRRENLHLKLQEAGEKIGDQFDCSTLRREDYLFHKGQDEQSDVLQCNNKPSSQTARGHQTPAAFMILTSGLKEHGLDSDKPLKYAHLDIAGSSGPFPGLPTGAPVMALLQNYFF